MILIPLAKLQSAAAVKPQGYYAACLAAGRVVGENLQLTEQAFTQLRARYSPPPLTAQLLSATGAIAAECGAVLSGSPAVTDDEKAARVALCEACEFFIVAERRCSKCGCWIETKTAFRSQCCPEAKW